MIYSHFRPMTSWISIDPLKVPKYSNSRPHISYFMRPTFAIRGPPNKAERRRRVGTGPVKLALQIGGFSFGSCHFMGSLLGLFVSLTTNKTLVQFHMYWFSILCSFPTSTFHFRAIEPTLLPRACVISEKSADFKSF